MTIPSRSTRREAVLGLGCTLGGFASGRALGSAAAGPRRPNVVLIVADDMAWGDLASHGNPLTETPVLDALGRESARLPWFIVSTVCAPSRASLMTGRYHLRTGTTGGVTHGLEVMRSEEVTIAELLRAQGYATGMVGKWHNGGHYPYTPNGQGFEHFLGYTANALTRHFDVPLLRNGVPEGTHGFITDVLTDEAMRFVEVNRERPFFLYVAHAAPHAPMQVPDRFFDKYKAKGPSDYDAAVYGMLDNLDGNTGRLLDRLDALGLADDTIVVFLSDNGPQNARFNGGLKGRKGEVDDGGVRVPAFIRYPRRFGRAGRDVQAIAAHIDLLPTIAALTGTPLPRGRRIDGISLTPALAGEALPQRMVFTHTLRSETAIDRSPPPFPGAVRTRRWCAVNKGGGWELYDARRDPGQLQDVAFREPLQVARLDRAYRLWFRDVTHAGFAPIPIPVGLPQAPLVELPASEAALTGGVRWIRPQGLYGDWIVDWRRTDDAITWDVEVAAPGDHAVSLRYGCPADEVGSEVLVTCGPAELQACIDRAHDASPLPGPDRVPRVVPEKTWGVLELGTLRLQAGRHAFAIRATHVRRSQVAELLSVHLARSPCAPKACDDSTGLVSVG